MLLTNNEFNRAINEEDIDFNVPGVPCSTVKQLHGASVRELIQKIENHPNRHVLQRDLQQSHSWFRYDASPASTWFQAIVNLATAQDKYDAVHQQRWSQSSSSSWRNWEESWWHSSYDHHHEDVPSTD